jgi:hypothetical protein
MIKANGNEVLDYFKFKVYEKYFDNLMFVMQVNERNN